MRPKIYAMIQARIGSLRLKYKNLALINKKLRHQSASTKFLLILIMKFFQKLPQDIKLVFINA